ncbi:DUF4185 domain-containing protein [Proteiniphilum acetatigenes]|uniref:DUF4185 domain-containing protein n=1 Tax=Proteiniphilum acetatigenes TaxID=294710 RepID=UPI00037ADEB7|nr:DUF4185 domain-containing protein [Proteiniphilum acetatigenes]
MKMKFILFLLPLVVYFSMCRDVKKSSDPRDVVVDTTMIKMLIPGDGSGVWSGGDGAISVPIKKDKSLWLFGDSFMGRIVDGKRDREKSRMVFGNLIVELDGEKSRTIHTGTPESPAPVVVSEKVDGHNTVYWPHHGFVKNNILHVLMTQIVFEKPGMWGFRANQIRYFRLRLPDYTLIDDEPVDSYKVNGVNLGFGFHEHEGYYYCYGNHVEGFSATLHAARAKLVDDKLQEWEYFDGTDWSGDPEATRPLEGIDVGVSSQFSVFPYQDKFILLVQGRMVREIYTFISDSPTGPWRNKKLIYTVPEPIEDERLFAYNAMAHPQYERDGMFLVSYCMNTSDVEQAWNDVRATIPYFIWITYEMVLNEVPQQPDPENVS